jgi:hypothetical protein
MNPLNCTDDIRRRFVPAPPSSQKTSIRRTADRKSIVGSGVAETRKRVTSEENRRLKRRKSALGRVETGAEESREGAKRRDRRGAWNGAEAVCIAKPEERETTIQSTGERVGVRHCRAGG